MGLYWLARLRPADEGAAAIIPKGFPSLNGREGKRAPRRRWDVVRRLFEGLDWLLRRWESSLMWVVWFLAVNFLSVLMAGVWLTAPSSLSVERRLIAFALVALFHVAAFLGMRSYIVKRTPEIGLSRRIERRLRLLTYAWLLPLPGFPLIALLIQLAHETESRRSKTLTYAAYLTRQNADRGAAWSKQRRLMRRKRRSLPTSLRSLYRLKTLLLWIDGAGMGALLAFGLGYWPPILIPIALGGVHLVIGLGLGLSRIVKRSRQGGSPVPSGASRSVSGKYAAATTLVFFGGTVTGIAMALGDPTEVGLSFVVPLLFGSVFGGMWIMLRPLLPTPREEIGIGDVLLWFSLLLALQWAGAVAVLDRETAHRFLDALWAIVLLLPIWHLLIAAPLLRWLLRPFTLKDLVSRHFPARLRLLLGLMALTCLLPLGGLAIPAWERFRGSLWAGAAKHFGRF